MEIKISELSIGDWVKIKGTDKIVKIAQINGDLDEIRVFGYKHFYCFYDLDYIEPILLTPEILEKNGLCVVEEDADFSEYELFGSENFSIFHLKGTFHYRLETPQASVVCWCVHQLQNALRLAGVEKGIEL